MESSNFPPKAPGAPRRIFSAPPDYQPSTTSEAAPIETLYVHPNVKIVSFTATVANPPPRIDVERLESGTLASSSHLERTIAIGSFHIYRAPGSVAFLSCGSALQPILPKSQCWCIDEDSAKFVLQIRRPNFWRIELPITTEEYQRKALALREVLGVVLQFEKTYCPFQRAFTVELPDESLIPVKKKPWTPKHLPTVHGRPRDNIWRDYEGFGLTSGHRGKIGDEAKIATTPPATTSGAGTAAHLGPHVSSHEDEMRSDRGNSSLATQNASLLQSPDEDYSDFNTRPHNDGSVRLTGSDSVASIVHHINSRAAQATLGNMESSPSPATCVEQLASGVNDLIYQDEERYLREVRRSSCSAFDVRQDCNQWRNVGIGRSASFSGDFTSSPRVEFAEPQSIRDTMEPSRSPSQDSFQSIESWHSLTSSDAPLSTVHMGSNTKHADSHDGYDDLRAHTVTAVPSAAADHMRAGTPKGASEKTVTAPSATVAQMEPSCDMRPRSSYRRLSTSERSFSPNPQPGNMGHVSNPGLSESPHSTEVTAGLPMILIAKTCEALLAPPAHLIALMLNVAAKLSAGQWRGKVYEGNNSGEGIPIHWDYSEDDLSD